MDGSTKMALLTAAIILGTLIAMGYSIWTDKDDEEEETNDNV